jgi:hypothetical protein
VDGLRPKRAVAIAAIAVGFGTLALRFVSIARDATTSSIVLGIVVSVVILAAVGRYYYAGGLKWKARVDEFVVAQESQFGHQHVAVAILPVDVVDMLESHATDARTPTAIPERGRGDTYGLTAVLTLDAAALTLWGFPYGSRLLQPVKLLALRWDDMSSIDTGFFPERLRSINELVIGVDGWRLPIRLIPLTRVGMWLQKRRDPRALAVLIEGLRYETQPAHASPGEVEPGDIPER